MSLGNLYEDGKTIIRVLAENEEKYLIIDCLKRTMPFWVHKDEFRQDYQQMIDALRALPSKPTIYLCTPIPAFKTQWTITDSVITNEVIPAIQKVAKKNKLQVIDLHTLFKNDDKKQIQSDGIHPNDAGAIQMANIIFDVLKTK